MYVCVSNIPDGSVKNLNDKRCLCMLSGLLRCKVVMDMTHVALKGDECSVSCDGGTVAWLRLTKGYEAQRFF